MTVPTTDTCCADETTTPSRKQRNQGAAKVSQLPIPRTIQPQLHQRNKDRSFEKSIARRLEHDATTQPRIRCETRPPPGTSTPASHTQSVTKHETLKRETASKTPRKDEKWMTGFFQKRHAHGTGDPREQLYSCMWVSREREPGPPPTVRFGLHFRLGGWDSCNGLHRITVTTSLCVDGI